MNRSARRARQRGAALIVLAALVVLGTSWMLVSAFSDAARNRAADQSHNARILKEARAALVGWIASTALGAAEDNPGRLPCPQAWGDIGTSNEGRAASSCSAPAVGLLPWRTLGLSKPLDASGRQLWYAISPGWHLPNSTTNLLINSNTAGGLSLDGQANAAIALLIAPGPQLDINPNAAQVAAGCTARAQNQQAVAELNPRDFLECQNASTADFAYVTQVVDNGANRVLNDQVLAVTTADVMPVLEAAIAARIERDIVPMLRSVYSSPTWRTGLSSTAPAYPFPAPFADPSAAASFNGSAASCLANACQGLLPMRISNAPGTTSVCAPATHGSLCDPTFVRWMSGTVLPTSFEINGTTYTPGTLGGTLTWAPTPANCTVDLSASPHALDCTIYVPGASGFSSTNARYEFDGVAGNVAMAIRSYEASAFASMPGITVVGGPTLQMAKSGDVDLAFTGRTDGAPSSPTTSTSDCGLSGSYPGVTPECRAVPISIPFTMFPDHLVLDSSPSAAAGWFMRNEWYKLVYYSVTRGHTADGFDVTASPECGSGSPQGECLTVQNLAPADNKRGLLILAGRSLTNTARPNGNLNDFLDSTVNRTVDSVFEKQPVTRTFNDRVVVLDQN